MMYVGLILFSALVVSFSQIMLKYSANREHKTRLGEYLNVPVLSAYALFAFSLFLNTLAYRGIEYKQGPVIASASYLFVLVLGGWLLKEKITLKKVLGNLLIIAGIVVFGL